MSITLNNLTRLNEAKEIIYKRIVFGYIIVNISIKLGISASILVELYDENNNFIQNITFILDGDNYQSWKNDDIPYIDNFIVESINKIIEL
jgi:hypothetical protein